MFVAPATLPLAYLLMTSRWDSPFHPHLTTVVQPSYEMGARAASILIDRIEGLIGRGPVTVRVAPTLMVRESTDAPTNIRCDAQTPEKQSIRRSFLDSSTKGPKKTY